MGSTTLPQSRPVPRHRDPPYLFVSVADMRASNKPDAVLSTLGLGSCLGITCYEPVRKVGGLLHAMLPDSHKHRATNPVPAMYLDVAMPVFIESALRLGADLRYLEFKVFGGAQILQANDYFSIGRQNIDMMKRLVERYQLNVKTWAVGGQANRSIDLYLSTGAVLLRMPSLPEVWI